MAIRRCILLSCLWACCQLYAQNNITRHSLSLIINDIYETVLENDADIDLESLTADLIYLSEHPINLNCATEKELQQLVFLTPQQIDAILLYVYRHPMESLYELQLIDALKRYDIRDMLPFVTVAPVGGKQPFHWREMWHYAKHEISLRSDVRNAEGYTGDPFYAAIKYSFNYQQKVQFGIAMERDPAEPWWGNNTYGFDFYTGFLQIDDIGTHVRRVVAGDYRAMFGQGLVVGNTLRFGGKSVITAGRTRNELRRYHSTGESGFFRGAGVVLKWNNLEGTLFYSARRIDGCVTDGVFPTVRTDGWHRSAREIAAKQTVWQQVAGCNLTWRYKNLQMGFTAVETLLGDTLRPKADYYNANFFQGNRQFVAGINYRWHGRRISIFGETAVGQNRKWGWANITGIRLYPCQDLTLVGIYRYYSSTYDALFAHAFGENTRNNDENGLYLGTEIKRLNRWRFACYADAFAFRFPKYRIPTPGYGYDWLAEAMWYTNDDIEMQWRIRSKRKGYADKHSLRYILTNTLGDWTFRTWAEGNIAQQHAASPTFGLLLQQDLSYRFQKLPLTLQACLQAFHAPDYHNRFYLYENDVLYAFSVPAAYGKGGRCYLNLRYRITPMLSVYFKAAHSVYAADWAQQQQLKSARRTDFHLLVRIRI